MTIGGSKVVLARSGGRGLEGAYANHPVGVHASEWGGGQQRTTAVCMDG